MTKTAVTTTTTTTAEATTNTTSTETTTRLSSSSTLSSSTSFSANNNNNNNTAANDFFISHDDVVSHILSYLSWKELILSCRPISKYWKHKIKHLPINQQPQSNDPISFTTPKQLFTLIHHQDVIFNACLPNQLYSLRIEQPKVIIPTMTTVTNTSTTTTMTESENDNNDNININNDIILTDEILLEILSHLSSIKELICRHCTHLRYFLSTLCSTGCSGCSINTIMSSNKNNPFLLYNLQSLNLHGNDQLEWNLQQVATCLPNLQDLRCINNTKLTGCLQDLVVVIVQEQTVQEETTTTICNAEHEQEQEQQASSSSLPLPVQTNNKTTTTSKKKVQIIKNKHHQWIVIDVSGCPLVTGNLCHDLRQCTKLKWLGVSRTNIQGDLRDIRIGQNDFPSLELIGLDPQTIYGASELLSVRHASSVMNVRHGIIQQSHRLRLAQNLQPEECPIYPFMVRLSVQSPEYHERLEQRLYSSEYDPPFNIELVQLGGNDDNNDIDNNSIYKNDSKYQRHGWRWSNYLGGVCAVHWFDPEPTFDLEKEEEEIKMNNNTTNGTTTLQQQQQQRLLLLQEAKASYMRDYEELQREESKSIFSEFLDPPTPTQYEQLCMRQF